MKKILDKWILFMENRNMVLITVTIIIGIIYIITLFNIQVINGSKYRERSEKKMLRTESISSARGEIDDSNGVILATNKLSYNLVIYKIKCENKERNDGILKTINILEKNGDNISSTFPVNETYTDFNFSSKTDEEKWKAEFKIDKNSTFEEVIDLYIYRYELEDYKREDAKKIIKVKYQAGLMGYTLFNPVTIAEDISKESVAEIEEIGFSLYGIETAYTVKRYYPYGDLFAHTIGYVSKISSDEYKSLKDNGYNINSSIGKLGIEQSFEKYLKGKDGIKKTEVDSYGTISSENITSKPIAGSSITLTIDYRLQKVAYDSLVKVIDDIQNGRNGYIKHEDAKSGVVVVLDTSNSEVLAMVNYPSFDTNEFVSGIKYNVWNELRNSTLNPMLNRAISGTYSPGSTYKMLVSLAGLESGGITTTEKINDPGIFPYGHNPKCWIYEKYRQTHGNINVSEAIKVSCNCYFYEVGRRIGISKIVEYSKLLGLDSKTGIEIAGETTGNIAGINYDENSWYLGQTLSASIGQEGSSYTPIALANYISAIANGGKLNRVKLVKSVQDEKGESISLEELNKYISNYTGVKFEEKKLDFKDENLEAIKYGMLLVTQKGGTSYNTFKNMGIDVAGKTGTAEVQGGTSNGIFVGFAPYDNPKIAVIAIIEHGGEGTYVANAVRPIMDEYFKLDSEDKLNEKNQNINDVGISF